VQIQVITHIMFPHAVALGALLDLKPVSTKKFTKLILTPAVTSEFFSSHQNSFAISCLTGCLCVISGVCCQAYVFATS
jgi:ABC-type maltose transport system permease subunit